MALALLLYWMAHWVCRYVAQSEEWLQSFTDAQLRSDSLTLSFRTLLPSACVCPQLFFSYELSKLHASFTHLYFYLSQLNIQYSHFCTIMLSASASTCKNVALLCQRACVFCMSRRLAGWLTVFARCELTWGLKWQRNSMTDGIFQRGIWGIGYSQLRFGTKTGAWAAVSILPPSITGYGHIKQLQLLITRRKHNNINANILKLIYCQLSFLFLSYT